MSKTEERVRGKAPGLKKDFWRN